MADLNEASAVSAEADLAEEIYVLESIYISELTVERDEKGRQSSMSVALHPATGMDESKKYVCMTLCFKFPPSYPNEVPTIMVKNPRGLGEENLQSLIEDMMKIAEERKGGQMLFELIEMAKDCLTEGNLPHCECAICLDHFEEGDNFVKTDCYHYFHRACLARCAAAFMASVHEQEAPAPGHIHRAEDQNIFRCPMCRVALTLDLSDLLAETPGEEKEEEFVPSPELRRQQEERAALYKQQKAKGGIIDLELEKNKFLVDENTVVPLGRRHDDDEEKTPDLTSSRWKAEGDSLRDRKEDVLSRRENGEHQPAASHCFAGRGRHRTVQQYDVRQGFSDYDDDEGDHTDLPEARHHRGRGGRPDHWGGGGGYRSQGRKHQGSRPPHHHHQVSKGHRPGKVVDVFFGDGGQGYSDYDEDFADGVKDSRTDRTGGRGVRPDCGENHRTWRGRGRANKMTHHRERRGDLRDCQGPRSDPRNIRDNLRDSNENLRERTEDSTHRKERMRDSGLQTDSQKDGDYYRRGGDHHATDWESNKEQGRHGGASPREVQHRDPNPARKQGRRGRHGDNRQGHGTGDQGPRGHRDRPVENRQQSGQDIHRPVENRQQSGQDRHRPGENRQQSGQDRHRPGENRQQSGQDRHRPGENRQQSGQDRHRPVENRQQSGQDRHRPGENRQQSGQDRHRPGENRQQSGQDRHRGHRDFIPRGHDRDGEDWTRERDSPREQTSEGREKRQEPQNGPRDGEGQSRPEGPGKNRQKDFQDDQSEDARHSPRNFKYDNDHGSWRERNIQTGGSQRSGDHHCGETEGRDKHKMCLAERQNSHENGDSQTLQQDRDQDKTHDRVRGDRTFVRGGAGRGRLRGRGRNRPPGSRSEPDTATTPSQRMDGQNENEDWDSGCPGQKNLSADARRGNRKLGQSAKQDGARDSAVSKASSEDWNPEPQAQNWPADKRHGNNDNNKGQRFSRRGGKGVHDKAQDVQPLRDIHDRPQKDLHSLRDGDSTRRQGPPPGFARQGPPPGFADTDGFRKPEPAAVAKAAAASVCPPPGFS
ncbi:uncharacterized protein LOC143288534 [Babylonia areolata]|uniref:uncharacterized protein LOC143288534 n=1 Tax=Babylonia areolata TaxID=304850 RepID=UPI003FD3B076